MRELKPQEMERYYDAVIEAKAKLCEAIKRLEAQQYCNRLARGEVPQTQRRGM